MHEGLDGERAPYGHEGNGGTWAGELRSFTGYVVKFLYFKFFSPLYCRPITMFIYFSVNLSLTNI